jgi:hypothetical protein
MKDCQYSGSMAESLIETIHLYSRVASDDDLDIASRLKFFHNAFSGEALRFCDTKVASSCSTFVEATIRMTEQFNSRSRQAKAKTNLNQLRLENFRSEKEMSAMDALENVREQMFILSPQCPPGFTSDAHQADALLNAVRGEKWASETLKRHRANPGCFQDLFQALESALVFDIAEKETKTSSVLFGENSQDFRVKPSSKNISDSPSVAAISGSTISCGVTSPWPGVPCDPGHSTCCRERPVSRGTFSSTAMKTANHWPSTSQCCHRSH